MAIFTKQNSFNTILIRIEGERNNLTKIPMQIIPVTTCTSQLKGVRTIGKDEYVLIIHQSYTNVLQIQGLSALPNYERKREKTEKEITTLRSIAGKLAWVANCSNPFHAFAASVAFQRNRDQPHVPIPILYDTQDVLKSSSSMINLFFLT